MTHFSCKAHKKRTLFDRRNGFIHGFITTISRDYKPTPRGKELRLFKSVAADYLSKSIKCAVMCSIVLIENPPGCYLL